MFIDLVRKRRSIRRFQERPVEKDKIDALVEIALRSPSSRGINPWEFVVVSDPRLLEQLSRAKPHGASFIKQAALAVVVCADPSKSDAWVEDASIAAIYLHLGAADLGLGSCWVQIRLREHSAGKTAGAYIAEVLGLRAGLEVEAVMAIGYAAESKAPHPQSALQVDKVVYR